MDIRLGMDAVENGPVGNRIPTVQPVSRRYTNWAIQTPFNTNYIGISYNKIAENLLFSCSRRLYMGFLWGLHTRCTSLVSLGPVPGLRFKVPYYKAETVTTTRRCSCVMPCVTLLNHPRHIPICLLKQSYQTSELAYVITQHDMNESGSELGIHWKLRVWCFLLGMKPRLQWIDLLVCTELCSSKASYQIHLLPTKSTILNYV